MKPNFIANYQEKQSQFAQELAQILELLDKIESHTAQLRNKILAELKAGEKKMIDES